jgi:hypothetical protein
MSGVSFKQSVQVRGPFVTGRYAVERILHGENECRIKVYIRKTKKDAIAAAREYCRKRKLNFNGVYIPNFLENEP